MARINDHLLVQQADDVIVLLDESTGDEFTFPITDGLAVARTIEYLSEEARL